MAEADRQDHCRSGGRGHCQGKRNPGQMSTAPARRKTMAGGHSGPRHVAIIMAGNGRWAKRPFLPRIMAHRRGVEAVRRCVRSEEPRVGREWVRTCKSRWTHDPVTKQHRNKK